MATATYKRVTDKVGLLQLDDGKANAFSPSMLDSCMQCLKEAHDDLLKVEGALVVAGNKKFLSTGFDLGTMMSGEEAATSMIMQGAAFCEQLALFPRPIIVVATGHAIALGALVLLTGDYRIGPSTVGGKPLKVGLNETSKGMRMPDFFAEAARYTLAPQFLRECLALGLILDAERAKMVGFLNEVVPEGEAFDAAMAKAEELAEYCQHPAFQQNKELVRRPLSEAISKGQSQEKDSELTWLGSRRLHKAKKKVLSKL